MFYVITIYFFADDEEVAVHSDTFKIDEGELLRFVSFLTTRINRLHSFNIEVKYL